MSASQSRPDYDDDENDDDNYDGGNESDGSDDDDTIRVEIRPGIQPRERRSVQCIVESVFNELDYLRISGCC